MRSQGRGRMEAKMEVRACEKDEKVEVGEIPDNCLGNKRWVDKLLVGSLWQFEFPIMPRIQQNTMWAPTNVFLNWKSYPLSLYTEVPTEHFAFKLLDHVRWGWGLNNLIPTTQLGDCGWEGQWWSQGHQAWRPPQLGLEVRPVSCRLLENFRDREGWCGSGGGAGFSTQESLLLVFVDCKGTLVMKTRLEVFREGLWFCNTCAQKGRGLHFCNRLELLLECGVGWEPEGEWMRISAKGLGLMETRFDMRRRRQGNLCGPSLFLGLTPTPFSLISFDFHCFPSCMRPVPQGRGSGARSDRLHSSSQAPSKPWAVSHLLRNTS